MPLRAQGCLSKAATLTRAFCDLCCFPGGSESSSNAECPRSQLDQWQADKPVLSLQKRAELYAVCVRCIR